MAVKVTVEIDLKPLEALVDRARKIDGDAVLYGIPEPAPMHKGKGKGKPPTVTTAFTLARVEFGSQHRRPAPSAKPARRRGRGRKTPQPVAPRVPTNPKGERPVLRWVAATQRDVMRDGFKAAAKRAVKGEDHRADLEVLGGKLADLARERITAVGGVDTGQTRASITSKVTRRY